MLAISSQRRLLGAIARARDVTLVAYLLPRGRVFDALDAAARRGAQVTVRLEGRPFHDSSGAIARFNHHIVDELSRDGADARLVGEHGSGPSLHAKAVVASGALYLDDVNFGAPSKGTLIRDTSRADIDALRAVARGAAPGRTTRIALRKDDAVAIEAGVIAHARRRDGIEVETESAGGGNAVYERLELAARTGRRVRLLVARHTLSPRERSVLGHLSRSGVDVRICRDNEKFAIAGRSAWIGSANATSPYDAPNQLDWGARSSNPRIVAHLRRAFAHRWHAASELMSSQRALAR